MAENNVPAEALVLAKVARLARNELDDLMYSGEQPTHYTVEGEDAFVAAALARHMVQSKTFFEHISPDTLAPLYRITQEPRGGEDGK